MTKGSAAAHELAAFLRSRRASTSPESLGLEPGPRRKVDGLRREEIAALAGLSTDYYQRLEQGRNVRPSDAVLNSIADALDLDSVDRSHLLTLARAMRQPSQTPRRSPQRVPANTRRLLARLPLPAFVATSHLDLLDWNPLAAELLGDPTPLPNEQRNVLLALFSDDNHRLRCDGWEAMVRDYVGMLRAAIATDPEHPRGVALVGELSIRSAEFRRIWSRHDLRDAVHGEKTILHPRLGEIGVEWDVYQVAGSRGPVMVVFSPQPGYEDRLQMLTAVMSSDASPVDSAVRPTQGRQTGVET